MTRLHSLRLQWGRRDRSTAFVLAGLLAVAPIVGSLAYAAEPAPKKGAKQAALPAAAPAAKPSIVIPYGKGLGPDVNVVLPLSEKVTALGTRNGLFAWDGKILEHVREADTSTFINERNYSLSGRSVQDLLLAPDGKLWVATDGGLLWYEARRITNVTSRLPATGNQGAKIGTPRLEHDVMRLFRCSSGRILIGTRNAGIITYDPADDRFRLVYHEPDVNKWLTAFAEMSTGQVVAAVRGLGLLRIVGDKVQPLEFPADCGKPEDVRTLCLGKADEMWIGTISRLIAWPTDGKRRIYTTKNGLADDFVGKVWSDSSHDIWVVGSNHAISVFRRGSWTYPDFAEGSPFFIGRTPDDDLWITVAAGVTRNPHIEWSGEAGPKRELAKFKKAIEAQFPQVAASGWTATDKQGRIWVRFDEQLWRYDGRTWTDLSPKLGKSQLVYAVMADSQGRIWVGTSGNGLFRFDGDEFDRFLNHPGRSISVIYSLGEAKDGTVYAGAQFGFYAFKGNDQKTISNQYQVHNIVIDDGRVWFSDINTGLLLFDGEDIRVVRRDWRAHQITLVRPGVVQVHGSKLGSTELEQATFQFDGTTAKQLADPPAAPQTGAKAADAK